MTRHFFVLVAQLVTAPFVATHAQAATCIDLSVPNAEATVEGELSVQMFPGPPNYESIANGDAEERALILEVPRQMCADDGEFINPTTRFDRVHVSSNVPALLDVLNAAIGRRVTIRGDRRLFAAIADRLRLSSRCRRAAKRNCYRYFASACCWSGLGKRTD